MALAIARPWRNSSLCRSRGELISLSVIRR